MAYLKPQSPIKKGENHIYPLTTYDQVIMPDGSRWSGEAGGADVETVSIILPASGWSDFSQTVSVSGMGKDSNIIVAPDPSNHTIYHSCGIFATTQGNGTLTFATVTSPAVDMLVNIMILS